MSEYYNNVQYPELYNTIVPICDKCIERHFEGKPEGYEFNNKEISEMTNEIYSEVIKKYPEINKDPYDNRRQQKTQQRGYGRRGILNSFIWFILLERLLRRRRRPFEPYRRPYGPYRRPYGPYRRPYDRYDYY